MTRVFLLLGSNVDPEANLPAAVALLRDSLVRPRFDDDAIERVRAQLLSSLRVLLDREDQRTAVHAHR